jgi:hypothetical protein
MQDQDNYNQYKRSYSLKTHGKDKKSNLWLWYGYRNRKQKHPNIHKKL